MDTIYYRYLIKAKRGNEAMKKDMVKIIALGLMVVALIAFTCEKIADDTQAHHENYKNCLETMEKRMCDNIYYR